MKAKLEIAVMVLIAGFVLSVIPQGASAQVNEKNAKQERKQAGNNFKDKVKELKAEGWKISGDYRTLDLAIIEFQNQLDENPEKYDFVSGEVSKCRSVDACKQMAQFQAQRQLATELNSEIKTVTMQLVDADLVTGDESNKMTTSSSRYVNADVSGILTPAFSLIKDNKDGTNSFQTIYLVDLAKKLAVSEGVLEKSLKETNVTIERSTDIQKFIKESFDAKNAENNK